MTTLQQQRPQMETMTPRGTAAVPTGIAGQDSMQFHLMRHEDRYESSEGWNRHLDTILYDWLTNLEMLNDGEMTPPSLAVIDLACEIAKGLRDQGVDPPDRVVLDGDGGIVFERRRRDVIESIEVYGGAEPKAELIGMQGGKVFFREEIAAGT